MTLLLNLDGPQAIIRPSRYRARLIGQRCTLPGPAIDERIAYLAERAAAALPLFHDGPADLTELAVLATRARIAARCRARAGRPRKR